MSSIMPLGPHHQFDLDLACRAIVDAYGWTVFHVGSSLTRHDYRDVDVRCILDDAEFARMFPRVQQNETGHLDPAWKLHCAAISAWLAQRTGLNIDFQFQRQSYANAEFSQKQGCTRNGLGVHISRLKRAEEPEGPDPEPFV